MIARYLSRQSERFDPPEGIGANLGHLSFADLNLGLDLDLDVDLLLRRNFRKPNLPSEVQDQVCDGIEVGSQIRPGQTSTTQPHRSSSSCSCILVSRV